ncbi:MAG: VWA domain-containing protein [Bacteroidia bacterium]
MIRGFIVLFCTCIFSGFFDPCHSQSLERINKKHDALNRYIDFTNESIHILWEIHHRLESFNADANKFVASGGSSSLKFQISDIINHYEYFGVLKGVCAKAYGVTDPEVNIKSLYEITSRDNAAIPETSLISLNRKRDDLMYLVIELISICDTLESFSREQKFYKDPSLQKVFRMLNRASLIYYDFQGVKDQLSYVVSEASSPLPAELQDLVRIMQYSRQIMLAAKVEDRTSIQKHISLLESAIVKTESSRETYKEGLRKLDLYYDKENMGYTHMIDYARQIIRRANEYLDPGNNSVSYTSYSHAYYQYNERLLSLFNHHKYGIIAYYNRFVGFANRSLVKQVEETPLFHVILPTPPQLADISEKSGLASPSPSSDEEEPTLEGAASNNMIFLLDVSASMAKPEKLPLLKSSMEYILELMRPEDQIAIVTYSGNASIVLNATSAANKTTILQAIRDLRSGGETNIKKGMRQAYKVAENHFIPGGNNRIILASDGAFELTSATSRMVADMALQDIQLSVFLLGKNDAPRTEAQLEALASLGGGTYTHVTRRMQTASYLRRQNQSGNKDGSGRDLTLRGWKYFQYGLSCSLP